MRRFGEFEKEVITNLTRFESPQDFGTYPFIQFLAHYFGQDNQVALLVKEGQSYLSLDRQDAQTFAAIISLLTLLQELVEERLVLLMDKEDADAEPICLGTPVPGQAPYSVPEPLNGFLCMAASKMVVVSAELRELVSQNFATQESAAATTDAPAAPEEAIAASKHAVKLSLELGIGSTAIAIAALLVSIAALAI